MSVLSRILNLTMVLIWGWFKSELRGRLASKNTFFESLGKQFEWGRGIIVTKG